MLLVFAIGLTTVVVGTTNNTLRITPASAGYHLVEMPTQGVYCVEISTNLVSWSVFEASWNTTNCGINFAVRGGMQTVFFRVTKL
jgi:hypothetical protein